MFQHLEIEYLPLESRLSAARMRQWLDSVQAEELEILQGIQCTEAWVLLSAVLVDGQEGELARICDTQE